MEDSPFFQKPQKGDRREERKNVRTEIQITVRYSCPPEKTETSVTAWVSNISEKGALFLTRKEGLPIGAEIHAVVQLRGQGNERPITVAGHVKSSKYLQDDRYGSGVEFFDVSEETHRKIRNFIMREELDGSF